MEKNYNLTRLNRYPISYNIETVSTPLKQNILKNKEIILNSFLQETYNQKKTKAQNVKKAKGTTAREEISQTKFR